MTIDDLYPYLGCPCAVRLRCHSCGGTHVLEATPSMGHYAGDCILNGYTFWVEQIEQVWRRTEPPQRKQHIGGWLVGTLRRGRGAAMTSLGSV